MAQHITIRGLARVPVLGMAGRTTSSLTATTATAATVNAATVNAATVNAATVNAATANAASAVSGVSLSTALIVSSCMKLFPILMVVWRYDDVTGLVGRGVGYAVGVQNVEALRVLMGGGYLRAAILVVGGGWVESIVRGLVLKAGGLG